MTNDVPARVQSMEVLATSLRSIGLDVVHETIEWDSFIDKLLENHDYEIIMAGTSANTQYSPLNQLWHLLHSSGSVRIAGIDSNLQSQFDDLLSDACWAVEKHRYDAIIKEINRLACENFVSVPIITYLKKEKN